VSARRAVTRRGPVAWLTVAIAAVALSSCGPPLSQPQKARLAGWLSCEDCARVWRSWVVDTLGPCAVPALGLALDGPPTSARDAYERSLRMHYLAVRRAALRDSANHLAVLSVGPTAFTRFYLRSFASTWQLRAASALAGIGTLEARGAVELALDRHPQPDSTLGPRVRHVLDSLLAAPGVWTTTGPGGTSSCGLP